MLAPPVSRNKSLRSKEVNSQIEQKGCFYRAYLVDEIEVALEYQSIDVVSFNARHVVAVLADVCQDRDHRV